MTWPSSFDHSIAPSEWRIALTHPTVSGPQCRPTVLERNVYADPEAAAKGDYSSYQGCEYRGACGCGWAGEPTTDENSATEAAHDHTHPEWRSLPILPRLAYEPTRQQTEEYRRLIDRLYPKGWLERGGPILTRRSGVGTRHVPGRAPGGGYDLFGELSAGARTPTVAEQPTLF